MTTFYSALPHAASESPAECRESWPSSRNWDRISMRLAFVIKRFRNHTNRFLALICMLALFRRADRFASRRKEGIHNSCCYSWPPFRIMRGNIVMLTVYLLRSKESCQRPKHCVCPEKKAPRPAEQDHGKLSPPLSRASIPGCRIPRRISIATSAVKSPWRIGREICS